MLVPPRWLVACSVAGALVASGSTVLLMPRPADRQAPVEVVGVPSFAVEPEPASDGPAVSGRQIAELAATPALRRAEEIARQLAPPPLARPGPTPTPKADDGDRDRIKKACKEGRMKGRVCRGR